MRGAQKQPCLRTTDVFPQTSNAPRVLSAMLRLNLTNVPVVTGGCSARDLSAYPFVSARYLQFRELSPCQASMLAVIRLFLSLD